MEYLRVDAIGDSFKCAYCRERFSSTVKMVPECGNSICGQCYEKASTKASEIKSKEYECKPCKLWHIMPANGLADNLALVRMLRVQPEVRVLPERAVELRKLIGQVREQLTDLNQYSVIDEIISHCDRLRTAVKESMEAKIVHLRKIGERHLKEIDDYQVEMVDSLSEGPSARPSKRSRTSETSSDSGNETVPPEEGIRTINDDFEHFTNKWNEYFTKLDQMVSEADVEQAHRQVREFNASIQDLKLSLGKEIYKHRLDWRENSSFTLKWDHLGQQVRAGGNSSPQDAQAVSSSHSDTNDRREEDAARPSSARLVSTLRDHTGCVYQIAFLLDGKLASCSTDHSIKIWKPGTDSCIQSLNTNNTSAISLAALPNGWLAAGCRDDSIRIFDLTQSKPKCVLKGHTDSVFMFRVLQDDTLASIAWDDTIKIWDPYSTKGSLLKSMSGHGNDGDGIDLGMLLNGHLVSCSNNKADTKPITLSIWDPMQGALTRLIQFRYIGASSLLVLSDDSIAVGCSNGDILIYDLKQKGNVIRLLSTDPPAARILSMVQLPNGFLVSSSCIRDTSIKIWNVNERKLVESIETGHTHNVWSLCLSPDTKLLATFPKFGLQSIAQ